MANCTEPFSEDHIASEQQCYQSEVVDLTKQRSSVMPKNKFDSSLLSPKPSAIKEQYSSAKRETTAEKIPIPSIIIPMGRKNISSRKQELSSSKTQAQLQSGQKKQLESVSFRTKKPLQTGKSNGAVSQRHLISAQKSEEGSSKLFAERKQSTQDSMSLRTV